MSPQLLDLTFPSPEENLACDEVLLGLCEERDGPGVLRFWEPRTTFVVLGYSGKAADEVDLARCRREGVPVLRRVTGGGTVVQGPGCLDYALILPHRSDTALSTITATNTYVMERIRSAVAELRPGAVVRKEGDTDITVDGRKVAGSAHRRGTSHVLFHGVFLLEFDLTAMDRFLPVPAKQPEHRRGRSHGEFVQNLEIPGSDLKQAISDAWGTVEGAVEVPKARISELIGTRYGRPSWNFKR
ncbi:MAG TPA: lipoate--protein ligase family protein [Bacteroidota bacterium]